VIIQELLVKLGFQVDGPSFSKADSALAGLKRSLAKLGVTLAAGAIVKSLKDLVEGTAASALEADRAAQRVGVSRVAYEELAHAAEESGVSVGSMEFGLRILNRGLYESSTGSKASAKEFADLGVKTKDGTGKLRGADDVLMDIAEHFKAMPDGSRKSALAMDLFGRSGTNLIPMLNKGRDGLAEFRKEAHEMGLVFSDEDVAAAKEFRVATSELHDRLEGIRRRIALALLPQLIRMKTEFAAWIKLNRELITQRVVAFASGLAKAFEMLVNMTEPLRKLGEAIMYMAQESEAFRVIAIGLGAVLFAMFNAPYAAALLLMGVIEEIWGWITGKRYTVLERMFGSYKDLKKDNPFVQWVDGMTFALNHMGEVLDGIKDKYIAFRRILQPGYGSKDVTNKDTSGATNEEERLQNLKVAMDRVTGGAVPFNSKEWIDRVPKNDPIFMGLVNAGKYDMIEKMYGPAGGQNANQATISIGAINVAAGVIPAGADPAEVARLLGENVGTGLMTKLNFQNQLSDAHATP
jgi:hypothetical protein